MLIYLGIPLLAMIIRRGNQNMDLRIILLGALIFVDKFKLLKSNNFLLARGKDIYPSQQLMELVLVAW